MNSKHLSLLLLISASSLSAQKHTVTVFIHGTCQAGLMLLNMRRTFNDTFTGTSWYERTLVASRNDPFLETTDLLLAPGFVEVTQAIAQEIKTQQAALHTIRSYDAFSKKTTNTSAHYYAFGWLGLMSETCREKASQDLYEALYALHEKFTSHGDTVTFTLHAHSHGAQVVLYLAQLRKERGHTDFIIDQAILSAPPLYHQKAKYALSGMFNVVLNIYSPSDMIQIGDRFSTPDGLCFRTFKQCMPMPNGTTDNLLIADVQIQVDGRTDICGHGCFFLLDRYFVGNYLGKSQKRRIRSLIEQLHPLPLVALYPTLLPHIIEALQSLNNPSGYHEMACNLTTDATNLFWNITLADQIKVYSIPPAPLQATQTEVKKAFTGTKHPSELDKAFMSLKHIFKR